MSDPAQPNKTGNGASGPGPVEHLAIATGSLAQAVAAREVTKVATLLDNLNKCLADKPWKAIPVDALVVAWTLCGEVLDAALSQEVTCKALDILNSLLGLCNRCSKVFEDPITQLRPQLFASKIGACLSRHVADSNIQIAGLTVLLNLAGCTTCATPHSIAIQTELGAGGAITSLAASINAVCVASAEDQATQIQILEVAVPALHLVTSGNAVNTARVAEANAVSLILAALKKASNSSVVTASALLLLRQVAGQPSAIPVEVELAINAVWEAANKQCDELKIDVAHAAMQAMPGLIDIGVSNEIDMELLIQEAIRIARHFLKTYENKDDVLIKYCLNLMTVAATYVSNRTAPMSASALSSLSFDIASVATKSFEATMQCRVLRTLHDVVSAAPVDLNPEAAAAVLGLLQAVNNSKDTSPTVVVMLNAYGIACLAILLGEGNAIEHATLLLEAASQACSMLSIHGFTLGESLALAPVNSDSESFPWPVLEQSLSLVISVLMQHEPNGINTTDSAGYTLLHRFAAMRDPRCLSLLLERAGNKLDLLVRTRGGANALQLARQGGHTDSEALLLDITQKAADALQEALLKELETTTNDADVPSRKSRKKKNITRSASFAAEQPDEKSQKLNANEDDVDADGVAAVSEEQRQCEEKLLRQQEREQEYERALEQRRIQIAEEKRMEEARAVAEIRMLTKGQSTQSLMTSSEDQDSDDMSTTSGQNGANTHSSGPSTNRPGSPFTAAGSDEQAQNNSRSISTDSGDDTGSDECAPMQTGEQEASPFLAFADTANATAAPATTEKELPGIEAFEGQPSLFGGMQDAMQQGHLSVQRSASLFEDHSGSLFGGMSPASLSNAMPSSSFPGPGLSPSPPVNGLMSVGSMPLSSPERGALGMQSLPSGGTSGDGTFSGATTHSQFQSPMSAGMLGMLPIGGMTSVPSGGTAANNSNCLSPTAGQLSEVDIARLQRYQELQDALFVQDSNLPQHGNNTNASDSAEASLFASLRNSVASKSTTSGVPASSQDSPSRMSPRWLSQGMGDGSMDGFGLASSGLGANDDSSDESSEPTRHLWIGNLGTRTLRSVLKNVFERFGYVDDVVTFPGRMYAFVNYRNTSEAITAFKTLSGTVLPDLSGDRPLLLKFRPAKKATAHLRALSERIGSMEVGDNSRLDLDKDGNCTEPSPRIWLGNIAPTASTKSLQTVLSRFGPLTDAAVFPARIGPLGYAFVKFERLQDAVTAFEGLNNTVVPALTGSKQLKMRYKPATEGPIGRDDIGDSSKAGLSLSRHLWLGNVTQKPTEDIVADVFARFGRVDSVRIFPAKAYAFVNFADPEAAMQAMVELDGTPVPILTGVKPLVMRYQQEGHGMPGSKSLDGIMQSDPALSMLGPNQLVPGSMLGISASESSSEDGLVPMQGLGPGFGMKTPLVGHNPRAAALADQLRYLATQTDQNTLLANNLNNTMNPMNDVLGGKAGSAGLHRSHSMGLLAGQQPHHQQQNSFSGQSGNGSAAAAAAAAAASAAQFASLLGMQAGNSQPPRGLEGSQYPNDALGLQHHMPGPAAHGGTRFNSGYHHQNMQQPHQQQMGSLHPQDTASGPKLTAVLNNLMALQRASSMPDPQVHHQLVRMGLAQPQPQQQAGMHDRESFAYHFGNSVQAQQQLQQPDIATLSALLANHTLSSFPSGREF